MNTKELRRGNLVQDIHGTIKYVEQIFEKGVQIYSVDNESDSSFYQEEEIFGVILTEEKLTKLGFEKSKTIDKYYTKGNNYAISCADNKFKFIQGNFICQLVLAEIDFVHQLQNIPHALTGEELTYKP